MNGLTLLALPCCNAAVPHGVYNMARKQVLTGVVLKKLRRCKEP